MTTRGNEWRFSEDRHCKDNISFTELPRGRSAEVERAKLLYLCMTCPVIWECYAAAKKAKPMTREVIQGGELW